MRLPLLTMLILALVNAGVDTYLYRIARARCRDRRLSRVQLWSAVILMLWLVAICCMPFRSGSDTVLQATMWMLFGYITVYIPKYLFCIFDLVASIPRLWHHRRVAWLSKAGLVVGVLIFAGMWWGALINRYRIQVNEVTVEIADLPAQFDGYTILQFSDLHTGTYGSDTTFIAEVVDKINSLNPDLIVFTGDIVNRKSEELRPFVPVLSRLKASDGVMSILGNHDYGDYSTWPSAEAKQANMQQLYDFQGRMGWKLLLNESAMIGRGTDTIAIIGVENIGDPPFHVYGDLNRAYPQTGDSICKILLSHNPAHWNMDLAGNPDRNIALTLSGHTHAMQIELAGLSPASWRYPQWGGLYDDADRLNGTGPSKSLYVNIGMGTVGIPMRLGATPELTLITLRRASAN